MIYQQGKSTMTIIVRGEGVTATESDVKDDASVSPKEKQEDKQASTTPTKKSSIFNKRKAFITITHGVAVGVGIANAGINYMMGDIAGTTGDKNLADVTQRNVEQCKDVADVLVATTMSAWYGSRGGWVTGIITAAMGFTTAMTSKASKYLGRERDYKIETFKMNNEINYARSRANINLTTGRLR